MAGGGLVYIAAAFLATIIFVVYLISNKSGDNDAPLLIGTLLYAAIIVVLLYIAFTKHQRTQQRKQKKTKKTSGSSSSGGQQQPATPPSMTAAAAASPLLCENGDYGDCEWDVGYKRQQQLYGAPGGGGDPANAELRTIGQRALDEIISKNIVPPLDLTLPEDKPSCCPLKTDWQAAFKGYPTTFISMPESAGGSECALGCPSPCGSHLELSGSGGASHRDGCNHDPRTWNPFLNERQYERARRAGEKWDPYKHHNARQMYAQFLAANMPNRKAFYERPIEHLEEASCFQQKISAAK